MISHFNERKERFREEISGRQNGLHGSCGMQGILRGYMRDRFTRIIYSYFI